MRLTTIHLWTDLRPCEANGHIGEKINESILFQSDGDAATCWICQTRYMEQLLALPCLHYYCKECIIAINIDKTIFCPKCHTEAILEGGVEKSLKLSNLKTALGCSKKAIDAKCESCSNSGTKAKHLQCVQCVCLKCIESHERMKAFEGHDIVSFEELKENTSSFTNVDYEKCSIHAEPLITYCFDCHTLACHLYIVNEHNSHKFEFCAAVGPKVKADIKENLVPLQKLADDIKNAMTDQSIIREEFESNGKYVAHTVESVFKDLYQILDECKQELLDAVQCSVEKKTAEILGLLEELAKASREIYSVVEYTEQCIKNCSSNEIVYLHTKLKNRIKKELERHPLLGKQVRGTCRAYWCRNKRGWRI